MNTLDIILIIFLVYATARGFMQGLFVEIAKLLALVLGIYGALYFSDFAAHYLHSKTNWSEQIINISAFAITFIVIVFVLIFIGKTLTKLANFMALGVFNKILGAIFGLIKAGLILSVLLFFFEKINNTLPMVDKTTMEESKIYYPVRHLVPTIFPNILSIDDDHVKSVKTINI